MRAIASLLWRRRWTACAGALCAVALAACGGGGVPGPATAAPRVFIDVVAALPRDLDPADDAQGDGFDALESSLAATLVRPAAAPLGAAKLAPAGAVVGFLASRWQRLAGGDYVFELRHGVRSAFGHSLRASDVVFSFRRELARSSTARALAAAARIRLSDPVSALGAERVRVNVSAVSPLTLAVLADFRFGVLDGRAVRAHQRGVDGGHAWLATHLASYSPYALAAFTPGSRVFLRALAHPFEPLAYDHVAIEAGSGSALALADLAGAEASHTSDLRWAAYAAATATSGLLVRTLPSTAVRTFVPDERFAAFANVLVRRAISLCLDRSAIAQAAFAGFAPPARHPLPSALALPADVAQPSYTRDVTRARRLLARAGYPRGFAFTLGGADAAERAAIASQLQAIGLRVRTSQGGARADARLATVSSPVASAGLWIVSNYVRGSAGDVEGFDAPALDALAAPLLSAASPAAALSRALGILASQLPVIPLVEVPWQLVSRERIAGYAAYPGGSIYYDRLRPS